MNKLKNKKGTWNLDEKLSKNFTLNEFLYKSSAMPSNSHIFMQNEFSEEVYLELKKLANCLQIIREAFGTITITCGYRPLAWECIKNRSGKSKHVLGMAADFYIQNTPLEEVYKFCTETFPSFGIAMSSAGHFIHIDTVIEPIGRRWEY